MKKGVIFTLVAVTTSLAVYAGVATKNSKEKERTMCCDKTHCCSTESDSCE